MSEPAASATWVDRAVSAAVASGSGGLLLVARSLDPSPRGFDTHIQLGLGRCSIYQATDWPCPMCGMTTTFAHMADLSPWLAATTQPMGVVLFLATVAALAVSLVELVAPRGRWRVMLAWIQKHDGRVAAFLTLGLIVGWTYKVVQLRGFPPWSP